MLTHAIDVTLALVILMWAWWCILSRHVDDGLVGKTIYFFASLSAFGLLVAPAERTAGPEHALTISLAMLGLRQMVLRYLWPRVCKYFGRCD